MKNIVFMLCSLTAAAVAQEMPLVAAQSKPLVACVHYEGAPPSRNYIEAMCDVPDGATNVKSVEYTFKVRGTIVKNSIKETNYRNRRGWTYSVAGPKGSQFEFIQVVAYTERRQPYAGEAATMVIRSLVFGGELTNPAEE